MLKQLLTLYLIYSIAYIVTGNEATCLIETHPDYQTLTNCSNLESGCPVDNFAFHDGHCGTTCNSPFVVRLENNSAYCDLPCGPPAYIYPNGKCSPISCDLRDYDTRESGLLSYCDLKPAPCWIQRGDPGIYASVTNCTNPDNDCPANEFKFTDRGDFCGSNCPHPYNPRREGLNAYCDHPYSCGPPAYIYPNDSCLTTPCDPAKYYGLNLAWGNEYLDLNYTLCYPWHYWCSQLRQNGERQSSNPHCIGNYCPESRRFLYENGSCGHDCLDPFFARYEGNSSYCDSPCSPGFYRYSNGTCVKSPVSLDISISYDTPFDDFKDMYITSEFATKLMLAMEVDYDIIQLFGIREDSTIEARIPVPTQKNSDSIDTVLSKAEAMKDRLSAAVTNRELNLRSRHVSDFELSVQISTLEPESSVVPEREGSVVVNVPERPSEGLEPSDSSGLTLGLSVGLSILVVIVAVSGFLIS